MTSAFAEFMASDANVLLLSGAAGSGKSTAYDKLQSWILDEYTSERKKEVTSYPKLNAQPRSEKHQICYRSHLITTSHQPHHRQYSHFTLSFLILGYHCGAASGLAPTAQGSNQRNL